jgi:hypothetical protein
LLAGSDDQLEALFQLPFNEPVQVWATAYLPERRAVARTAKPNVDRFIMRRTLWGRAIPANDVTGRQGPRHDAAGNVTRLRSVDHREGAS